MRHMTRSMAVFKPEVPVAPEASSQDKLLAYTGRDPFTLTRPANRVPLERGSG